MRRLARRPVILLAALIVLTSSAALSALLVLGEGDPTPRRPKPGWIAPAPSAPRQDRGADPLEAARVPADASLLPGEAGSQVESGAEASGAAAPDAAPFAPPVLVTGLVLRPDGTPAAGVRVALAGRRGTRGTTDAAGAFALWVPPGRYRANAASARPDEVDTVWVVVEVGPRGCEVGPLLLRRALALSGAVRAQDGRGIAGAELAAVSRRGPAERGRATSDPEGRFRLERLPEGLYGLRVEAPGFVSAQLAGVPLTDVAEQGSLEVVLERAGGLEGIVRDPAGQPVARALVFSYVGARRTAMVRADAQGRFRLDSLAGGPVELFVRSDDFELTARGPAHVTPGATLPIDVGLREAAVVSGALRDAAGEPRAGLRVRAALIGGDVRRDAVSDPDGHFRIGQLYPGRYELTVRGQALRGGAAALATAQVTARSGVAPLDLVVPAGARARGRIVTPDGAAAASASVYATLGGQYAAQVTAGEDGTFALPELPPGDYTLFARADDDRWLGRLPLPLGPGERREDLVVRVEEPLTLGGRVVFAGAPVRGLALRLEAPEAPVRRSGETDDEGRFAIGRLYPGRYRLSVDPDSLRLAGARLGATLAAEPLTVHVQPGAPAEVEVRLRPGG